MDKNVWYSVKDKLPELNENGESVDVLVIERKFGFSQNLTYTDTYKIAYWNGKHWEDDNSEDMEDNLDYFSVVYWMYIPDAPDKK